MSLPNDAQMIIVILTASNGQTFRLNLKNDLKTRQGLNDDLSYDGVNFLDIVRRWTRNALAEGSRTTGVWNTDDAPCTISWRHVVSYYLMFPGDTSVKAFNDCRCDWRRFMPEGKTTSVNTAVYRVSTNETCPVHHA